MENEEKTETPEEPLPEYKGKNLDEAISHAEHKLKILRSELNYEIVTEKTKLFGLSKEIVIHAWPKSVAGDDKIATFLEKLKAVFPLELTYEIKSKDGFVFVIFDGEDKQLLLWKDGALLLALQHSSTRSPTRRSRWTASSSGRGKRKISANTPRMWPARSTSRGATRSSTS
jgi:hypothetical protein